MPFLILSLVFLSSFTHAAEGLSPKNVLRCEQLRRSSVELLDEAYTRGTSDEIPRGLTEGCAVGIPGRLLNEVGSAYFNLHWQGKEFFPEQGKVMNRVLNLSLFEGQLFVGASWDDSHDAIIIDYFHTNLFFWYIRDEIRNVQPDLYLGKMFRRTLFGGRQLEAFFALFTRQ